MNVNSTATRTKTPLWRRAVGMLVAVIVSLTVVIHAARAIAAIAPIPIEAVGATNGDNETKDERAIADQCQSHPSTFVLPAPGSAGLRRVAEARPVARIPALTPVDDEPVRPPPRA